MILKKNVILFRFANILILLLFPELMMLVYDVWMSNIIALKRYKEWPETKTLINVSFFYIKTKLKKQDSFIYI